MLGFLKRQFNRNANSATAERPPGWFMNWAMGGPNNTGVLSVTEETAMKYEVIYACVGLISSTIASLPLVTYKASGRNRQRAKGSTVYRLLHDEMNPAMSAMSGRESGIANILTWGNSFAQIVRNRSGSKVLGIYPQSPDTVRVKQDEYGGLYYEIYKRGTTELLATLPSNEMLHVPGPGFDGKVGYSPIRMLKTSIETGIKMQREAEKFISRGIRPPGAVKFPPGTKFKDEQEAIKWRNRFKSIHAGEDSGNEVVVLENGTEWQSIGVDPESAQLLESRKFTRREICGIYRVPPHMIGDVEASTSWGTGIEEQKNAFVTFCLLTWMKRIEQEYNRKLFGNDPNMYCEHLAEGLLRGSLKSRAESLQIMHLRGIITDNEWRAIENYNPVPGGDVRRYPLNEGRIDIYGNDVEQGESIEDDNDDTELDEPGEDMANILTNGELCTTQES